MNCSRDFNDFDVAMIRGKVKIFQTQKSVQLHYFFGLFVRRTNVKIVTEEISSTVLSLSPRLSALMRYCRGQCTSRVYPAPRPQFRRASASIRNMINHHYRSVPLACKTGSGSSPRVVGLRRSFEPVITTQHGEGKSHGHSLTQLGF